MSNYKLKAGDNPRKPVLKRSQIVVYVPVLLICFLLACLIWLYVVGLSRWNDDELVSENQPAEETTEETFPEDEPDGEDTLAGTSAEAWNPHTALGAAEGI